ncbi:MAG: GLPGLI family protein [Polaribacter sp.]|jgi:GLPGLI family protein|tara:strand:+ start:734 stop:1453 length:720 start_codon:yes stop_codon:yes gene_type:complete
MKKRILFCTTLILFTISISAQNFAGKITYKVSLNFTEKDLKELELNKDKAVSTMRQVLSNSKDTDVVLNFNTYQSYYKVVNKLEINDRKPLNMTYAIAGSGKIYYIDLITKKNYMQECDLLEKCYLIEQPKLEWQLTQQTKIIGGYVCYKAVNSNSKNKKQKPVAWYTPQISASFGPKEYFGLPGLVLELEEAAVVFKAIEIILNPKEKIEIELMEGIKITKEEYNKKLQKSYSDIYQN